MDEANAGFELRISAQWSVGLIAIAAVSLMLSAEGLVGGPQYIRIQTLGAYLTILLVVLWWVLARWPTFGRWLLILATSISVVMTQSHLDQPGILALLALPAGMAVAFISVRAGAATVIAQTLLLLGLHRGGFATGGEIAVSLFATWSTLGILGCVYYPVYELMVWSWSQFQQSQIHVGEARDRRAQLEQTLQDLSRANRQLTRHNQRMSALRTVADEAQRSKTAFVSRVSHEFRAPLNMIIGLAGLMIDRPEIYAEELPSDLRMDLEIIHRNSTYLAEMISDVLDLSQTDMGRLTLHREHVDLTDTVTGALQAVSRLAYKKGLKLVHHLPAEPLIVYCDRTRIRQVLLNLLSNAALFTEAGTIALEVSGTPGEVVVEVSDTGPGIASEALQHIFEPFYRAVSTSQAAAGSGLGLSISREIIRHHSGRIWVDSELGQGTRFSFSLPTAEPVAPTARPGHQIIREWEWHEDGFRTDRSGREASFSRPLVVVHDPEDTLVRELQRQAQEIEFLITHTADESVEAAIEYPAHAILVNTHTCRTESTALLNRLRSAAPGTLVVACDVPNPLARAWAAGADAYLIKPISRENLSAALDGLTHPVRGLLIVEDDPDSAQLIARMIETLDASISVSVAGDATSATAAMHARRPDLVLLDVIMPGDDGWSVLASMRADPHLADVSVFFVSGLDPSDAPPTSEYLTVTLDGGISSGKLLTASLGLSRILLAREN